MSQAKTRGMQKMPAQCPFCSAAFKSTLALQAHTVYSHRAGFFTCAWCSKIIESESKIQKHAKSCPKLTKREEHEFEAFCIVGSYCDICESSFPSDIRAIKHYKEIHLHCTYICGICVKHFHRKENFDLHCADKHSDENQSCQMEKPKISERSIDDKRKLSMEFNEKRCIDCQINFTSFAEISDHFLIEHQFKMHVCMKCGKGYTQKKSLFYHPCRPSDKKSRQHRKDTLKDFRAERCLHCGVTFANNAECSKHFLLKHGSKIRVCPKCDGGFMNMHRLKYHKCRPVLRSKSEKSEQPSKENSFTHRKESGPKYFPLFRKIENGTGRNTPANGTHQFSASMGSQPRSLSPNDSSTPDLHNFVKEPDIHLIRRPSDSQNSSSENDSEINNSLDASTMHLQQTIKAKSLEHISSDMCSTSIPSNVEKREEPISTRPLIAEATASVRTFFLTDSKSETEPAPDSDTDNNSDVEILEWNPGTDVKPVIKLENNMDWN